FACTTKRTTQKVSADPRSLRERSRNRFRPIFAWLQNASAPDPFGTSLPKTLAEQKRPGRIARASFDFAGRESALTTATAAWTSTATTTTATIVVCGPCATVWWSTSLNWYAFYSVEVRLIF